MLMSGLLYRLLLAGTCLCVYGTPGRFQSTQDSNGDGDRDPSIATVKSSRSRDESVKSELSKTEHVSGLILNGDTTGGAGPEGIAPAARAENGDSLDGRSRPSKAHVEQLSQRSRVKKVRRSFEMRDTDRQSKSLLSEEPERSEGSRPDRDEQTPPRADRTEQVKVEKRRTPRETRPTSYAETSNPSAVQRLTSDSPIVVSVTSTPLTMWGHDEATISSFSEPLIPEFGPNLMPRDDGLDSLWTEATRPDGAETVDPLSQDEAIEGTMSSESLPLIFEPFEDGTPEEAAAAAAGFTPVPVFGGMPLSEVDAEQLVTAEADGDGPSHAPSLLIPEWMSPWQTSGAELQEPMGTAVPSVSQQHAGTGPDDPSERVAVRTPNLDEYLPTAGPSLSSFIQHTMTTVTMAANRPAHKSRSGLEEMESEEEADEEDKDENSEESVEDESEEDQTDSTKTSLTQPPYSLIPPPPVWVQRNQGLMRSWVELIREKAGYVSGMLAPVGIGITGALLIVGALYSIRMIHRKRRNSFKHQRRKIRQPEPAEPCTSHQDQAMLLADSSEDEF